MKQERGIQRQEGQVNEHITAGSKSRMDPERRKSKLTLRVRTFDGTLKSLDTDALNICKVQPSMDARPALVKWDSSQEDRRRVMIPNFCGPHLSAVRGWGRSKTINVF